MRCRPSPSGSACPSTSSGPSGGPGSHGPVVAFDLVSADADVIVVGAGLAGLVATAELADAGRRVILLEQEPEPWLGGQAFWSFGGLFLVNSPEQRRLGVRDSHERALQDWMVTAGFDRPEDRWPRTWAERHVTYAAGENRAGRR